MPDNNEPSKYRDRSLAELFSSQFANQDNSDTQMPDRRVSRMHSERELIKAGALPQTSAIDTILENHGLDRTVLPIHFSQSAANYPPAVSEEDQYTRYISQLPAGKRYIDFAAESKEDELKLSAKMETRDINELLKHSEEYIRKAEGKLPPKLMDSVKRNIKGYRDAQGPMRDMIRGMLEVHPEIRDITISPTGPAPMEEFLKAVVEHHETITQREIRIINRYAELYLVAKSSFAAVLYPEEYRAFTAKATEAQELFKKAQEEYSTSQGYRPPELMSHARRQLSERHGVTPDTVENSYVGICNGSSIYILDAALNAKTKRGQAIITPELHFDGYDFTAAEHGLKLMEVPRDMSMSAYMEQHFSKPEQSQGWKGLSWKKKPAPETEPGALLITNPCSITGRECDTNTLREYLNIAKDYNVPIIFNEIMASPDAEGRAFRSVTSLPEYQAVKDKVMIVSSTSKTGHIPDGVRKLSYFMTGGEDWGNKTARNLERNLGRPFDKDDVSNIQAYLGGVDKDYWVGNEKTSADKRDRIESWMKRINAKAKTEAVKWYEGRPEKGYISAIEFDPGLLKKAGIHNSLELYEYLYKTAGVSTGVLLPVEKDGRTPRVGVRLNYSFDDKTLDTGLALMQHAVSEMQRGTTLTQARQMCPSVDLSEQGNMLGRMLMGLGGGGVRIVFVDPSRYR